MSEAGLDNYDKKIIALLQEDSSISNLELSKKIGLAPSSCLVRVKNLKEKNVLKQFTTIVDAKSLGYTVTCFATVELQPLNRETSSKFIEEANNIPQIIECYTISGAGAFLLKIVAKDLQFYRDFVIDKLMAVPCVSNVITSMVLGVEKQTNALPLD